MTIEIPKEKWAEFFDDLSKRRFGWGTKIEIIDESVGVQILSEGLGLTGITFEERSGRHTLEIAVGERAEQHQTHTILNPVKVVHLDDKNFPGGVIEIEEENGTQTVIKLADPMPIYQGYTVYEIVMVA